MNSFVKRRGCSVTVPDELGSRVQNEQTLNIRAGQYREVLDWELPDLKGDRPGVLSREYAGSWERRNHYL